MVLGAGGHEDVLGRVPVDHEQVGGVALGEGSLVLEREQVGVHENFFDIGATSLNLLTINNRLKQAFSREIPVAVLFEYTSVARLAGYLDQDPTAGTNRLAEETRELSHARETMARTRNLMKNLRDS